MRQNYFAATAAIFAVFVLYVIAQADVPVSTSLLTDAGKVQGVPVRKLKVTDDGKVPVFVNASSAIRWRTPAGGGTGRDAGFLNYSAHDHVAPSIAAANTVNTPADSDTFGFFSGLLKKITWVNIKTSLKAYFDTVYHGATVTWTELTGKPTTVAASGITDAKTTTAFRSYSTNRVNERVGSDGNYGWLTSSNSTTYTECVDGSYGLNWIGGTLYQCNSGVNSVWSSGNGSPSVVGYAADTSIRNGFYYLGSAKAKVTFRNHSTGVTALFSNYTTRIKPDSATSKFRWPHPTTFVNNTTAAGYSVKVPPYTKVEIVSNGSGIFHMIPTQPLIKTGVKEY